MKTIKLLSLLFLSSSAFSQTKSMLIGGIEVRNVTSNTDILRSMIYQNLVRSKKYVVNDRYDVSEKLEQAKIDNCLGKECLSAIGKQLKADYALSASYEGLGDRILISMKVVDVNSGDISINIIEQFENQSKELNRMTDYMIAKLVGTESDLPVAASLIYKDSPTAAIGVGRMNNNGPRVGFALVTGETQDFLSRSEADGGLNSGNFPVLFNIGYQLEKQYAASENFSGLFEFIGNVAGLERGIAIPSLAILNGCRFGKDAWEIALGPSITVKQELSGTTDFNGKFTTSSQLSQMGVANPENFNYFTRLDARGATYVTTHFVIGIGKTFRPGAMNLPINAYASINKSGANFGISAGFNITRSKKITTFR